MYICEFELCLVVCEGKSNLPAVPGRTYMRCAVWPSKTEKKKNKVRILSQIDKVVTYTRTVHAHTRTRYNYSHKHTATKVVTGDEEVSSSAAVLSRLLFDAFTNFPVAAPVYECVSE